MKLQLSSFLLATVVLWCATGTVRAQESVFDKFRSQNAAMSDVQPAWMGPMIQPDARLTQSLRLSVATSSVPGGTRTVNWGNYHTVNLLAGTRMQFNFVAPPYLQNHSSSMPDGFGDTMLEGKWRLASGNAQHGNYALTAEVAASIPTASHQNGWPTSVYYPLIVGGKAWGRFNVQSMLGGALPAGKIAAQGRQINWNLTGQVKAGSNLYFDVENNATWSFAGPFDGKPQNFLTPAAFYVLRRKNWKPNHPVYVPGIGMQIATSQAHLYNHNLITELRVLF